MICFQVNTTIKSGWRLIDDALKMISGCIIPSPAIINSGSLSTTYLGSVLSGTQMDSVNRLKSLSSIDVRSDDCQSHDLTVRDFAATLFPVSTVFNSCFRHRSTSTECKSAILTFGAGNYCCSI